MALRLHTKYKNVNNIVYEIFIFDEDYVGSVIDFNIGDDRGAVVTWQGADEELKTPVLTSKLEVNMFIDSADVQSFVDDLNTAYEGQFRIVLKEDQFVERWVGLILPDLVEYDDLPILQKPVFKLVATDGIKRLRRVAYKDTGGPYTGEESIVQHLIKCIAFIGTTDIITYNPWVLRTASQWVPASIIAGDVLDNTDFDHRALYQVDENGNNKYPSVYRVIEQLCLRFHARFYMFDGSYWFVQHNYHNAANWTNYRYTSAGALWISGSNNVENPQDGNFTAKYGGGKFSFFPPLDVAQVNYVHFGYANIAQGYTWSDTATQSVPVSPTVYRVPANTSFFFNANFWHQTRVTGTRPAWIKFDVTFNVGSDYLQYEAGVQGIYEYPTQEQQITASVETYELFVKIEVGEYSGGIAAGGANFPVSVETIPFTNEGAVSFDIAFNNLYDADGNTVTTGINTNKWKFSNVELLAIPEDDVAQWTNTKRYTAFNATTGNSEKKVVNLIIGDDFGYGRLRVDDGAGGTDAADWGLGASSVGQSIEQLLAEEMMRTQGVPIRKLTGQIEIYLPDLFETITHNSDRWVPYKFKYITYRGLADGSWWLMDTTGSTSGNTEEDAIISDIDTDGGNNVTPSNPIGTGPPTADGGTASDGNAAGVNSVIDALFPRTTADINDGATVTTIPIESQTEAGVFKNGQTITLVDPVSGAQQDFTVTQDTAVSDTTISVTSDTANFFFREGSWIITSQEQQNAGGGSAGWFREEFPAHASATITITVNSGNLPLNAAAIKVYYDTGQIISKNYWSHSGSDITLTYTPNGAQSIWVEFPA